MKNNQNDTNQHVHDIHHFDGFCGYDGDDVAVCSCGRVRVGCVRRCGFDGRVGVVLMSVMVLATLLMIMLVILLVMVLVNM